MRRKLLPQTCRLHRNVLRHTLRCRKMSIGPESRCRRYLSSGTRKSAAPANSDRHVPTASV